MSKQVVLFIVEGVSDKISLGYILDRLIRDADVRFVVVGGDFLSDTYTTVQNILRKVKEKVDVILNRYSLHRKDLLKIIHLVDADGVFVGEDYIQQDDVPQFVYSPECIRARSIKSVLRRNQKKSSVLKKLCSHPAIAGVPYEIYYFSCNIEHVLHNQQNADQDVKSELAEIFENMFAGKEEEFIEFISNEEIAAAGDFQQTWEFIMQRNNSLNRYSNFHLFFQGKD